VLVVATEWPEFADEDLTEVADAMRGDLVMDLRNLLDPEAVSAAGLRHRQIGKPGQE